ncbi:unnamed protein product [Chondrus crispus]|uniref:Uncharacterized protein n=1 Tax=Chondrus crispus TaxID=2769 RepID=R7QKW2_CHOCR|nr:unnamed protein product [Chondrus crispus]CDF38408.1 unnamed protein product [Chondrus crispus]|eukprot:XP_005718301.1 unnamed protein product [Chondrus crispus]
MHLKQCFSTSFQRRALKAEHQQECHERFSLMLLHLQYERMI